MNLKNRIIKLENLDNISLMDKLYMLWEVDNNTYKCDRRKVCYSLQEIERLEDIGNKVIIIKWGI